MAKNKKGQDQQSENISGSNGSNQNRGMDEFENTTGSKGGQVGGNREGTHSNQNRGEALGEDSERSDAGNMNGDNLDEF